MSLTEPNSHYDCNLKTKNKKTIKTETVTEEIHALIH